MECRTGRLFLFCRRCHGTGSWAVAEVEIHVIIIVISILVVIIPIAILHGTASRLIKYMLSMGLWYFFRHGRRYGSCNRSWRWGRSRSGCRRRCRCGGSRAIVIVVAGRMSANMPRHTTLYPGGREGRGARSGEFVAVIEVLTGLQKGRPRSSRDPP